MNWEAFYFVCFLIGFVFSVLSVLGGGAQQEQQQMNNAKKNTPNL